MSATDPALRSPAAGSQVPYTGPTPVYAKLEALRLRDFTVFPNATVHFSKGLNVIVGENGLGKTHVLKVGYCLLEVLGRGRNDAGSSVPTKKYLQTALANKLRNVFKPESVGRLARRRRGTSRSRVSWRVEGGVCDIEFSSRSGNSVEVLRVPDHWTDGLPIYLPARELMSTYPGFVSLYETTHLEFDETMRDTCVLLGAPLKKGPREEVARSLLEPLEVAMGGKVVLDPSGRFFLQGEDGRIEMHLLAEGFRKLAAIARLIATGAIFPFGTLFWDEPESNLHPDLIRLVAQTIVGLVKSGLQVVIGTHSLFLLRELEIQQASTPVPARYFGLQRGPSGVTVAQGPAVDDIGDIGVLEAQLSQSERFRALRVG